MIVDRHMWMSDATSATDADVIVGAVAHRYAGAGA